ncbi:MAG: hypothetical protein WC071_12190 [Victivallaceae bacterium]
MNIQVRNLNSRKTRSRNTSKGSLGVKIWVVFNIIIMLGAIFLIANYRISLNQGISNIERETIMVKSRMHELDREVEALRIKREKLASWQHIRTRIADLRLNLRMPEPYQVQQLVLDDSGNEADNRNENGKKIVLSQR